MKIPPLVYLAVAAPTVVCAQTIYIDFGGTATAAGADTWNPFSLSSTVRDSVGNGDGTPHVYTSDLLDSSGASTGIGFTMTDTMSGTNNNGSTDSGVYPSDATSDSFYGTGDGISFSGFTDNGQGVFVFSNMSVGQTYNFTFYASRMGVSDNRETVYTLDGSNSGSVNLNPAGNIGNTVSLLGIEPTAGGDVTLTVSVGPNNTNGNEFYYVGGVEIVAVPEPGAYALLAGVLMLGLTIAYRRR
ncbi:hypothetical protein [Cerasicoccus frondis]|uniref:hypothetical protein n=1 Tax=Cerasicoccus frondis TaxID=490090 RepID=UPI0028526400|nr:hypothetical protein [Cerasicoccus frondis]